MADRLSDRDRGGCYVCGDPPWDAATTCKHHERDQAGREAAVEGQAAHPHHEDVCRVRCKVGKTVLGDEEQAAPDEGRDANPDCTVRNNSRPKA